MFMYRQSSDWLARLRLTALRYSSLCLGIRFKASVALDTSGRAWGHAGPGERALRTPDQCVGGRVGENLVERE